MNSLGSTVRSCAAAAALLPLYCGIVATTMECRAVHGAAIVLLTENNGSLTAEETARRTLLQSLGHTVATLWDGSVQSVYDSSLAAADAVYVSEECSAADVGYKLRLATVGVISEDPQLDDELGFATVDGASESATYITIADPAFGSGPLTIFNSSQPEIYLQGTAAAGARVAANTPAGRKALAIIEAGSPLANTYAGNSVASGRRLRLPWGGDAFTSSSLNSYGVAVLQMAVAWAVEKTLLVHWKLDEAAGAAAADSSSYARTGSVVGAGSWTSAVRHRGLGLGGAGKVQTASLLNNPYNISLAAWVKLNAPDASGADVISLGDRVVLRITATAISVSYFTGSGFQTLSYNVVLGDAGWHHLAATFDDPANSLRLYLDGVQVASSAPTASINYTGGGTATVAGAHGNAGTGNDLDGILDDVRIYGKILTAAEVRELYGLLGRYQLDELAGPTASDSSGNGNNGAVSGAPAFGKAGVYAKALGFSDAGTSDMASLPGAMLQKTTSASVTFWLRPTHTGEQAVLSGNASATDNEFLIFLSSQTEFRTYFHGVITSWTIPNIADGKWHHFVVTTAGETNTTTVYLDGVSQGAKSAGANGTAFNVAAAGLVVGQEQDTVGGGFSAAQRLIGDLDELQIYNRALLLEEVIDLYGLCGYWKFDEGGGGAYLDVSGAGRHAAIGGGGPAWIGGVRSNALRFDGVDDEGVTNNKFNPPATGTLAFWFRPTATATRRRRPLGLGGDWEIWQDPDGIIRFDLSCDGEQGGFKTIASFDEPNRWRHVAAVFDASDESFAIYIDGQLHHSGVSTRDIVKQAAAKLSFGNRTGATERFDGDLDDVRIYNRKLTQAEIFDVYGLAAWYKLDEVAGPAAVDSTGLGNNGVYSGSPTLGAASNGGPGMGTAVQFSGSNYVEVPTLYGNPTSVTIAAWAKPGARDSSGAELISLGDHFSLRISAAGDALIAQYYNGSTSTPLNVSMLVGSDWRHYAAVFESSGMMRLYVDGYDAGSVAVGSISYAGLGTKTRIASHGNGSALFDYSGLIDDVRIYNRALQADEAYRLYRGTRINGLKILQWVEVR
ncbi:MAG: hypothetical protein IT424_15910 [Pirellulales bacterium]|nr:hypothetical protein [Pirellulales bacterium]